VRPTTDRIREAWMSSLLGRLEGARVLDLFAGSGALGLEALSRGAKEAVFVERSRGALAALRANIETLKAQDSCRVVVGDALAFLRRLEGEEFDRPWPTPLTTSAWHERSWSSAGKKGLPGSSGLSIVPRKTSRTSRASDNGGTETPLSLS
jgi:hypothetical protein